MQKITLGQLAEKLNGRVKGDSSIVITSAATLENAGPGDIAFLSNKKYVPQLKTTKAAVVITSGEYQTSAALLILDDPYYAFMQTVVLLHGHRQHKALGISPSANITESAKIGSGCSICPFVTISDNAAIGKNCYLYPNVFIGPDVTLGDDCIIYPNAVIYDGCRIGSRVIIHANATIGQDGFGFATHKGVHHKIPQTGKVIIEDDVEIGASCAIERATLQDTVIGQGSKVGDLVAIGHGTKVGPHCLLVPQVGIAGSTTLGHHCVLGGQVGVAGHIKIGNMVTVGAQAGVLNNVPDSSTILGAPAIDANKAKRAYSLIQYLPEMRKKIRTLEKQLEKLTDSE